MLDPPKSSISGTPTFLLFYGLALQRDYSLHLLTFPQHVEIAKPENWRKTCSTSAISLFYHTQFYPFDLTSLTLDPPVCVQAAAGLASSLCTVLSAAFGPVKEETEYFSPWDLEGRETSDVALISERKFFSLKGASQTSVTLRGTIRATLDASTLHYSVNHRERGVAYAYMELAINTIKENARGLSLLDANSLSPSARAVHCGNTLAGGSPLTYSIRRGVQGTYSSDGDRVTCIKAGGTLLMKRVYRALMQST